MFESLTECVFAAADWEGAIWTQLLVGVIVVAALGLWYGTSRRKSAARRRRYGVVAGVTQVKWERLKAVITQGREKWVARFLEEARERIQRRRSQLAEQTAESAPAAPPAAAQDRPAARGARDKRSGMELLERAFLVHLVEDVESDDEQDAMLRRLGFCELARRDRLSLVSSDALAYYAVDRGHIHDKAIQCEAIQELSRRTARQQDGPVRGVESPAVAGKAGDE